MAGDDDSVLSCRLPATDAGLAQLGRWVDGVCATAGLEPDIDYALRLCLEEVVANIVMHGGATGSAIAISVAVALRRVTVRVEDAGAPFDPTAEPPPLAPEREGGRGLALLRRYARTIAYRREGGCNRLTLTLEREPRTRIRRSRDSRDPGTA